MPGPDLIDWVSPNSTIESTVYLRGEEIVGYARLSRAEPHHPRIVLAADGEASRSVAAAIARRVDDGSEIVLPLHPMSAAAGAFAPAVGGPWEAAMALSLAPNPLNEYLALLQVGARPAGRLLWPVEFDL